MATTREEMSADKRKPRSRKELEELYNSPGIQALVKESREQFERGEYVRIPIPEIMRKLRIGG